MQCVDLFHMLHSHRLIPNYHGRQAVSRQYPLFVLDCTSITLTVDRVLYSDEIRIRCLSRPVCIPFDRRCLRRDVPSRLELVMTTRRLDAIIRPVHDTASNRDILEPRKKSRISTADARHAVRPPHPHRCMSQCEFTSCASPLARSRFPSDLSPVSQPSQPLDYPSHKPSRPLTC